MPASAVVTAPVCSLAARLASTVAADMSSGMIVSCSGSMEGGAESGATAVDSTESKLADSVPPDALVPSNLSLCSRKAA